MTVSHRGGVHLSNPALAFVVAWSTTILLCDLRLTEQLLPLNRSTVLLVVGNMASAVALYTAMAAYFRVPAGRTSPATTHGELEVLRRWVRTLLTIWAAGSVLEIVTAKGLPILWIIAGNGRSYADFGIPMFHGFMQALFMFGLTGSFLEAMLTRRRSGLVLVALLLLWPIVQLSRGAMMWAFLELASVWLVLRPIGWRALVVATAAIVAIVYLFGLLGDLRSDYTSAVIALTATERGKHVFESLPSGFIWVYTYMTTPLNNIVGGIDRVSPTFTPFNTLSFLLPSGLRAVIFPPIPGAHSPLGLIDEAFNTSTIYVGYLADWGMLGAMTVVGVMQGVASYFHVLARYGRLWAILAYAALFQAIVLSIFADSFAILVTIAQIGLTVLFGVAAQRAWRRRHAEPARAVSSLPQQI